MFEISVVIPAHNPGKYLLQAVKSAVKQDMDLEIIVVDDASTDGACERLKTKAMSRFGAKNITKDKNLWRGEFSTAGRHIWLLVLTLEKQQGVAEARNAGVRIAQGRYIAFLDADDMWENGKLAKQLELCEREHAAICNTGRLLVKADGSRTKHVFSTPERITLKDLECDNVINCSSVLCRKEVLKRFPMERSDAAEDYLTWLKVLRAGYLVIGIDEPLLLYRLLPGSKSANKIKAVRMHYKSLLAAGYKSGRALKLTARYLVAGVKKYTRKVA